MRSHATPGAITTANLEQQKEGAVMENLSNPTTAARPLRMPFGRRGLFLIGLALVAGGAAFNWGWLTAIGAAPIILSLAPCALMCVAGLCMAGGSKSCAAKSAPAMKPEPERD